MPYTLIKTNGTTLTIVQDGTVDNTTSLTFVGKNFTGYGDPVNENFVKLIENFANITSPANPLMGQLWFDSGTSKLKFYNGNNFKPVAVITTGTTKPIDATIADLHFDGGLLWTYTGNSWLRIGPLSSSGGTGSSALPTTSVFAATGGVNPAIPILIGGNTATVISTASSYAVASDDPLYNTFNGIYPGINLPNTSNTATSGSIPDSRGISGYYDGTAIQGNLFWGTAGSSLGLVDYTNSIPRLLRSTDFITKDSLSQLGALSVNSDDGITINNVFQLHVTRETGVAESNISNIRNNVIRFNINDTSNGTYTNFINFDARSGYFRVLPTTSTGVSLGSSDVGAGFSDIYVTNVHGTSVTATSLTSVNAAITNITVSNLSATNTIFAPNMQLSSASTINGSTILTAATLSDNSQLSNGAGYITSATVPNFAITSVHGTNGQINTTATTGSVTLSLPNSLSVQDIVSTGSISANAMSVQGSPVLTSASFSGTGITVVLGTANQISVSTAGTQVTLSLPSGLSVNTLNGNAITVGGVPVLTSGTAVSSLYPGTTGLLLNGYAGRAVGDITLSGVLNAGNGGTGQGTYATGDLLYAGSSNPSFLTRLAAVASGNALISQGVNAAPTWGKISLTANITDILSVNNGGTGDAGSLTGYVYGNGGAAMTAATTIPGSAISGNITGNAANISAFTVNQNVGTADSPTFAGLTITGTTNFSNQVSVATATNATSAVNLGQFDNNKSTNGYTALPNGLIMQWGFKSYSSTSEIQVDANFNKPFPNACFNVSATPFIATGSVYKDIWIQIIGSPTTTKFTVQYQTIGGNSPGLDGFYWYAIGM